MPDPLVAPVVGGTPEIQCSVCDRPVPDADDIVCADCYETSRKPLPDPVTLTLSRDDCHTILGYLISKKKLTNLRIRFFDALEKATLVPRPEPRDPQEP